MNIIRLLNKIREYQFRQNIIRNLKNQIEEKENQLQEITQKLDEARAIIAECIDAIQTKSEDSKSVGMRDSLICVH